MDLREARSVHFIGVGGYSMSGLAEILKSRGYRVTGSDAKASTRTERLLRQKVPVTIGHDPSHVDRADIVVYTSDVREDNVEFAAARKAGTTLLHRSDVLAALLAEGRSIAVTGSHGKTTTTTLTGHLLEASGREPTVMVGGEVDAWGGGVRMGRGEWIVAEADESDGSHLKYTPDVAVITNVEAEHLDHYGGDFDALKRAMADFVSHVKDGGTAVLGADDPYLSTLGAKGGRRTVRYGLGKGAALTAGHIVPEGGGHAFDVVWEGRTAGRAVIPIPGLHNVTNGLAALGAAMASGVPLAEAIPALAGFANAHRRFEVHYRGRGILVVDDYAHHPTEIRAEIEAARELGPRRLIVAFQPQRYSRTKSLFDEFAKAFDGADVVYLLDIYAPPGEAPIAGVSGERLAAEVRRRKGDPVFHVAGPDDLVKAILPTLREGDVVLTLGAGDIFRAAGAMAEGLA